MHGNCLILNAWLHYPSPFTSLTIRFIFERTVKFEKLNRKNVKKKKWNYASILIHVPVSWKFL